MRRTWSVHTEQASLLMREPVLEQAKANYEALVSRPMQMQLAREIAQSRGAELTLAYRNVVMVSAGFRRRDEDGAERLTKEPCVIFVVRRKWKSKDGVGTDRQFLPDHLLAHAFGPHGRVLVAVPTDVQLETRYASARAQSNREICVRSPMHLDDYGALTAAVVVSLGGAVSKRGLCPMHVLTPTFSSANGMPLGGATIEIANGMPQQDGARQVGTSIAVGGQLVPGPEISFDAQLLEISNDDVVFHMLEDVPLSGEEPFITSPARYDELVLDGSTRPIEILLADNHPNAKDARPRLFLEPAGTSDHAYSIQYENSDGEVMLVQHWMVIHLQCPDEQEPLHGDSGAPVVMWLDGERCTFVGMHIAGEGRLSHVLPAWALMFPGSYLGTLSNESQLTLALQP